MDYRDQQNYNLEDPDHHHDHRPRPSRHLQLIDAALTSLYRSGPQAAAGVASFRRRRR